MSEWERRIRQAGREGGREAGKQAGAEQKPETELEAPPAHIGVFVLGRGVAEENEPLQVRPAAEAC